MALGVSVVGVLALPALAAAATRYAAADSTVTSGSCGQGTPCALPAAVSGAAAGDEVIVAPGSYTLSKPLQAGQPISLHGADGQAAPRIVAGASVGGGFAVGLKAGSSVRHLVISTSIDHQAALTLTSATADDLVLSAHGIGASTGQQAALMIGTHAATPSLVRDTVAFADGSNLAAIGLQGSVPGTAVRYDASASTGAPAAPAAQLINVTAVSTGSASTAIKASGDAGLLSFTDAIARGSAQDILGPTAGAGMSYSDFRPSASTGVADQGHNIAGDPLFADGAGGDLHELAGSPTVDAGVLTGQSGAADPDGNSRTLGAAPDIGAYELVPPGSPTHSGISGGPGLPAPGAGLTGSPGSPGAAGSPGAVPTLVTAAGLPLPAPVAARSVNVAPVQGQVLIRLPGQASLTPLVGGEQVPVGSTVDASAGTVELVSARDFAGTLQAGRFWGGRFVVGQHGASRLLTVLTLAGDLSGCRAARGGATAGTSGALRALAARARHPRARLLWGSDNHGQFSTRGRNAVATVRGTVWMMQDRCGGTLTKVVAGRVSVRNLRTGRSFTVTAGHQRLVRTKP